MGCVKNLAARFAADHVTGIADFALGPGETGLNGQLPGINIRPHSALTMRPPVQEIISRNAGLVAQTEGLDMSCSIAHSTSPNFRGGPGCCDPDRASC